MNVRDLMSSPAVTCRPDEPVSAALERLWSADCGILPVVEGDGLRTVVTDRDIVMALALRGRGPAQVKVSDVTHDRLITCAPGDSLAAALESMAEHKVRRLPVVEDGRLVGVLSMNDLVRAARAHRGPESRSTYGDIVKSLRRISSAAGDS